MDSDKAIRLGHSFELYVPTRCVCRRMLDESLHASVLRDIKGKMSEWFGGSSSTRNDGNWIFPDGSLSEMVVDVVKSFCSDETFESHQADMRSLAVTVADRLSQDSVLLSVDGEGYLISRTDKSSKKCNHDS